MLSSLSGQPMKSVSLIDERIIFMQPDMDPSNFGVDKHENTILMDFGEIAMRPESFVAYALSSNNNLADSLGVSSSAIAASMSVISCLWAASDPKLGASACTWLGI
jgi:hypothetical protein